ncbi:MAG TPA: group II intron reverse transcriptase/maturase [Pirellulales bacterium]
MFADSPQGGRTANPPDASGGRAHLLHKAKLTTATDLVTTTADTSWLLEQVASEPNLATALLNVARNQGASGVDGCSVIEVVQAAPKLLPQLRRHLLDGSYQPGDIRRVWIPKPGGGQRGLGIPNVIDRWVQQAVLQVLDSIYEPTFHGSSHGFRSARGGHTAIAEAKTYVEAGYGVVVDIDLSKFFDRVHHQRLLDRLSHRIADRRIIDLIRRMLKARVVLPDGMRVATEEGTPQDGPLSPLLSNIVLDEFDWELQRRGLRFVRYADDCNIFVRSERAGQRAMSSVRNFIEQRLRLLVNEEKSKVARPAEVHFLGFRLCESRVGQVEIHISARTKERMDAKTRELTPRTWGQSFSECVAGLNRYLNGWFGYFRICTEEGATLFWRFDAHIRRRLRAIIVHQKKRPRYLCRHLIQRGFRKQTAARTAYRRCGSWRRSNLPGLTQAYRNAWFHERLVSLWFEWKRLHADLPVSKQQLLFDC